jgi:DTW domain-containing protein
VSRRDNARLRCAACRMHASLCVCALVAPIATRTRLVLVIHRYEDRKPTNTGRLAASCLVNSEIVVRGHRPAEGAPPEAPLAFPEGTQPLLLYPAEDATPLTAYAGAARPVVLVVPDGNWRQAAKMRKRVPGLAEVPCVSLPAGAPTAYRLRFEPQKGGLATLEAVARAFGVLEGPAAEEALLRPFRAMVERTLWARGELAEADVRGGLPPGAMRHDPTSGLARPRGSW